MSAFEANPTHSDAAVIDVGSNSVRLVLYRLDGRAIWTVYNEKVLAGLGRDLAVTGRLSLAGVAAALTALRRFRALIDTNRPGRVYAAATAAVRDAEDGARFCQIVRKETGFDLRVLSGQEEARYAALGVLAGAPHSSGLVGDLGGASLELSRLQSGEPQPGITLPLGPFSMGEGGRFDADKVRAAVAAQLAPFADAYRADTLNAVGGAWRNLALLHMRLTRYPLAIVHQYELSRSDALEAAAFVSQQSRGSLERIEGISKRRMEGLPHAAVVLEGLIQTLRVERVVISAYGLREGLLLEGLSPASRRRDPLVEGCAALGSRQAVAEALGAALERWLAPAFESLEPVLEGRDAILIAAACRLAELGAQLHPDHRAQLIFEQVLRAPIPGMNHVERVFLACAAFARHSGSTSLPELATVSRLLSPERAQRARALGTTLRLGCELSGRSPELLARVSLTFEPGAVVLEAPEAWVPLLLGEQTAKRGASLAGMLGSVLRMNAVSPQGARTLETV